MKIEDIKIGDKASLTRTIKEEDIISFAKISGDNNPLHLDEEYAKNSMFKERIAHGILVSGLISAVIGTRLPGEGAIYLSQDLKFLKPVKIGDTITAEVEVIEINSSKRVIKLRTICINQCSNVVIDGEALTKLM